MKVNAPDFLAKITLYSSDQGGRQHPIVGEWFGCPCKFDPEDFTAWDCRILTNSVQFSPGETREFEMVFLTPQAGRLFHVVRTFYLWEGHIIGEAHSISRENSN